MRISLPLTFVIFCFSIYLANGQAYNQSIGPFQSVNSSTPFTFTSTPPTTGSAMLVYSWGACWQSGFGPSQLRVYLNTSSGSQQIVFASSTVECGYTQDSVTISASLLSNAIATGGGKVTGTLYIIDGCAAGWGCSNYNDPIVFGMILKYTTHTANFTSANSHVCPGGSVNFTDASINSPTSWQWSFPGGSPSTSTLQNPVVTYSTPGNYDVTLISQGTNTDTITYTNFVTVYNPPVANAGIDAAVCYGVPVNLSASGGTGYSWYPPVYLSNQNIANPVATPVNTIDYIVTATDAHGCTDSDTVKITIHPLPFLIASAGINPICLGDTTQIGVVGAQTYSWTPSSSLNTSSGQTVFAHPFSTTTYTITGTDFYSCVNTTTVTITVNPNPPSPSITQLGGSLVSSPATIYQWFLNGVPISGATSQSYVILQNGVYTVQIGDANGCKSVSLPFNIVNAGIDSYGKDGRLTITPNPTTGNISVHSFAWVVSYELYDIYGKIILDKKPANNSTNFNLDISGLKEGCYFLKVSGDKITHTSKVLKIANK